VRDSGADSWTYSSLDRETHGIAPCMVHMITHISMQASVNAPCTFTWKCLSAPKALRHATHLQLPMQLHMGHAMHMVLCMRCGRSRRGQGRTVGRRVSVRGKALHSCEIPWRFGACLNIFPVPTLFRFSLSQPMNIIVVPPKGMEGHRKVGRPGQGFS
jgi:hypothetical protein